MGLLGSNFAVDVSAMKTTNVEFLHERKETPAEVPDSALVFACGRGELEALGILFERHRVAVYRFLSRLAGTDAQDLDDLVQTTFIEVQKSAKSFKGNAAVRSWILGISANVVKHHVRSDSRRKAALRVYREVPRADSATPHDYLERGDLVDRLAEAVEGLSYKNRVAFALCDLEGLGREEAAKSLGIRVGTLWRRLHDARKQLKAALER
jgi:RNA polymerase sigma-70 factor, ECF subfamily